MDKLISLARIKAVLAQGPGIFCICIIPEKVDKL